MGMNYATVQDVFLLKRDLTSDEASRAEELIPIVCSSLRFEAAKRSMDLDTMVEHDEDLAEVARSVTVDVVMRELMISNSAGNEPMTQFSQSALGYSVSGTYLVPGGGLFIKNTELARLGIKKQRFGVIEPYAY